MPDDFATRKCHPQIPVAVIHDLWLCFLDQIPRDEYFPHGVISYMMSACPFYGSGFVLTNSLIVFIRLNQLRRSFTLRAPEDLETLPEQDQKPIQCLLGPQQNQALPWHSWISFTSFKLPSGSTVVRAISMCSKLSPPWLRRLTRSMRNVWRLAYNWVKHLMIWCKKTWSANSKTPSSDMPASLSIRWTRLRKVSRSHGLDEVCRRRWILSCAILLDEWGLQNSKNT